MQIEIARHAKMSESGSSLLRLIQNNDTPKLDLLIRESLQNCLDAGDRKNESVLVNIYVNEVETSLISSHFCGIDSSLNQLYPGKQSYIGIQDTHTVGLTGPIRYSDISDGKFGNFLKLVYEISKPQEQSGSGGSWGLGKTVYFRIGIGLVIYYSRIFVEETGQYESRLAAALVEDEKKEGTLLPAISNNLQRGIAWWGDKDPNGEDIESTIPVRDEKRINSFIRIFGIEPFSNDETGTLILIPIIDQKKLLEETLLGDMELESQSPYWCRNSVSDYLKIAIQRWYAPRLNNPEYSGQYLEVSINGTKLRMDEMAPIFRLVQNLYNSRPDHELEFNDRKINSKVIEVRNAFQRGSATAGWINYIKVTSKDMRMEAPDNLHSPYYYINKMSSETLYDDPILLYVRKPGMVVAYETTGEWTDTIPKTDTGEYLVAVFIVNSDNQLIFCDMTLEDYIRGSEKADHMAWDDWTVSNINPHIILKIKRGVRKKIKDDYAAITAGDHDKKNLGLGKMLADYLLPPSGYTYWDDASGGTEGEGGVGGNAGGNAEGHGGIGNNTQHVLIKQIGNTSYENSSINIPVRVLFGKKTSVTLYLEVSSENGTIGYSEWEKEVGREFPLQIQKLFLNKIYSGKKKNINVINSDEIFCGTGETNGIHINFLHSDKSGKAVGLKISVPDSDEYSIDCTISYSLSDVQGKIIIKEEH